MIRQYATGPGDRFTLEMHNRIVNLEIDGVEGLQKAITSPHGKARRVALWLIVAFHKKAEKDDRREVLVDLMKNCLADPNKVVRYCSARALLRLDVPMERKHKEFVPLIVDLFEDRSSKVRRKAAYMLLFDGLFAYVPLERAALALANNQDEWTRRILSGLVKRIIAHKA